MTSPSSKSTSQRELVIASLQRGIAAGKSAGKSGVGVGKPPRER